MKALTLADLFDLDLDATHHVILMPKGIKGVLRYAQSSNEDDDDRSAWFLLTNNFPFEGDMPYDDALRDEFAYGYGMYDSGELTNMLKRCNCNGMYLVSELHSLEVTDIA